MRIRHRHITLAALECAGTCERLKHSGGGLGFTHLHRGQVCAGRSLIPMQRGYGGQVRTGHALIFNQLIESKNAWRSLLLRSPHLLHLYACTLHRQFWQRRGDGSGLHRSSFQANLAPGSQRLRRTIVDSFRDGLWPRHRASFAGNGRFTTHGIRAWLRRKGPGRRYRFL
jgi:hypothetical protein